MKKAPLALGALAMSILCASPATARPRTEGVAFRACGKPAPLDDARCGVLTVPEVRKDRSGRTIPLHIMISPGADRKASDPLVFIAGGPGQSAIDVAPLVLAGLRPIDKARDIIFIDQRGTGSSNPLSCSNTLSVLAGGDSKSARACASLLQRKAALENYLTADAVEDLEAVRVALGLERIGIVAVSYGVRPALEYMRRHPHRVSTAVLRAAYAPDFNIITAGLGNADDELGRVLAECQADAACNAAFPDLRSRFVQLQDRLVEKPAIIQVASSTGRQDTVAVTNDFFQLMLYALLLSAESRQSIPLFVNTAATKGLQPLSPVILRVRDALYGSIPLGMYLSVVCSEDAPRIVARAGERDTRGLSSMAPKLAELCSAWPKGRVESSLFAPIRVSVPTLVISGDLDPATTAASAEKLVSMLPNAKHLIAPATSHGPMVPTCAADAVASLWKSRSVENASADCSGLQLPAFAGTSAARPR